MKHMLWQDLVKQIDKKSQVDYFTERTFEKTIFKPSKSPNSNAIAVLKRH